MSFKFIQQKIRATVLVVELLFRKHKIILSFRITVRLVRKTVTVSQKKVKENTS